MLATWKLGGLGPRELAKRVFRQAYRDEVPGRSAELAFHFLFAVFPALLVFTVLLGHALEGSEALRDQLAAYLSPVVPNAEAVELVRDTLAEIRESRSGGKLSLGLLLAAWAASNGMMAVARALNAAFDCAERRPWWARRLIAGATMGVFGALLALALVFVFYGGAIGERLARTIGAGGLFLPLWNAVHWIVMLAQLVLSFDLIYNFAPDQREREWRWLTPGAVTAVVLWLGASLAFRLYLAHFTQGWAYGSLGAVIVLMMWFYLTGAAILIGGEVNSEIHKAELARASAWAGPRTAGDAGSAERRRAEESKP